MRSILFPIKCGPRARIAGWLPFSSASCSRSKIHLFCTSTRLAPSAYLTLPTFSFSMAVVCRKSSAIVAGTTPSSFDGFLPPSAPYMENVLPAPDWPYANSNELRPLSAEAIIGGPQAM